MRGNRSEHNPRRKVGRDMGWLSNPSWVNPNDRMYDVSETGALPLQSTVETTSSGKKRAVVSSPGSDFSMTGPEARTSRGARRAVRKTMASAESGSLYPQGKDDAPAGGIPRPKLNTCTSCGEKTPLKGKCADCK